MGHAETAHLRKIPQKILENKTKRDPQKKREEQQRGDAGPRCGHFIAVPYKINKRVQGLPDVVKYMRKTTRVVAELNFFPTLTVWGKFAYVCIACADVPREGFHFPDCANAAVVFLLSTASDS